MPSLPVFLRSYLRKDVEEGRFTFPWLVLGSVLYLVKRRLQIPKGLGLFLNPLYLLVTEARAGRTGNGAQASLFMFVLHIIAFRVFGKVLSALFPPVRHGELEYTFKDRK